MGENLLSFGSLLLLPEKDSVLKEVVESLGGTLRVRRASQDGYVTIKKAGVELLFQKQNGRTNNPGRLKGPYILTRVTVKADKYEGYKQYAGKLVKRLTFASTREDVRRAMGAPVKSGGGNRFKTIVFPEWDRFRFRKKYCLHFSYLPETFQLCSVDINLMRLMTE